MTKTSNKEDKINEILKKLERRYKNPNRYRDEVGIKIGELTISLWNHIRNKETEPYLRSFLEKHPHVKAEIERHAKKYLDGIYNVLTYITPLPDRKVKVIYYVEYYDKNGSLDYKEWSQTYTYNGFARFLKENIT